MSVGKAEGSCPFYDEIDSIMGTRAASQLVILLDSGTEQCDRQWSSCQRA